jgi:hypothetical protein
MRGCPTVRTSTLPPAALDARQVHVSSASHDGTRAVQTSPAQTSPAQTLTLRTLLAQSSQTST